MSKVFRPRRGRKSLMSGYKAGALILEEGELFIEYPDEGIGKSTEGTGVGIKVGDGHTRYSELPYYLQEQSKVYEILEQLIEKIDEQINSQLDAFYNACVAEGQTPDDKNIIDISKAIGNIRSGGNATADQILYGKTSYANKSLITGNMANNGSWSSTATPTGNNSTTVTIPAGYHSGSGTVTCNGGTAYTAGQNYGRTEKQSEYHAISAIVESYQSLGPDVWITVRIHATESKNSAVLCAFEIEVPIEEDNHLGSEIHNYYYPGMSITVSPSRILIPHSWKGVFSLA